MTSYIRATSVLLIFNFAGCIPKHWNRTGDGAANSNLASIAMDVPPSLKPSVGPDKINAYSLELKGGSCDSGEPPSAVIRPFAKLQSGDLLTDEKIKRGCDYTLILTLGKADPSSLKMEKVYLTSNISGKQALITREQSKADKIRVVVTLFVTEDGKKDLGIDTDNLPVPSLGEVDAIIVPSIGNPGASSADDFDWRKDVKWATVPTQPFAGNTFGSAIYKDIMEHTSAGQRYLRGSRSTQAHETLHGLAAEMRNRTNDNDAFVYFEAGQGVYVSRPKTHLNKVQNYVGSTFKTVTNRFELYLITSAQAWDDPLFLFDEWNGYIATTRTSVELFRAQQWDNGNSDPISGVADLLYFGSAVVLTLKELEPDYVKNNQSFKIAYAMLAEQSIYWMNEGLKVDAWKSSKSSNRLEKLRKDPENEKLRQSIKEFMGLAWTKRVLGF